MEESKNLEIARLGENLARKYLRDNGYRIIEQNYKSRYAEIDLVAEDKGILVFVEVRTRTDEQFGRPEETINRNKINKLIRNAQGYMLRKRLNQRYRIDAVCVVLGEDKKPARIDHYKSITL
jgi:putative endonuclease